MYDTKRSGEVPVVDAVATHIAGAAGEDGDELTVFAVNRRLTDSTELTIDLRAFPGHQSVEHSVLSDPDVRAVNTEQQPDRVRPYRAEPGSLDGGRPAVQLPSPGTSSGCVPPADPPLGGEVVVYAAADGGFTAEGLRPSRCAVGRPQA